MPVRLLVVADDALAGEGLTTLLSAGRGLVAAHASSEAALTAAADHAAEVVVWDLGLRSAPSTGAITELAEGGTAVLVLAPDTESAMAAWAAGARGVLARTADGSRLRAAVEALAQGLAVGDPGLVPMPGRPTAAAPMVEELTTREHEVLQLLAEGLTNRGIAERLGISERTARFHTGSILGKLGAGNRSEAIVLAHRRGLIVL